MKKSITVLAALILITFSLVGCNSSPVALSEELLNGISTYVEENIKNDETLFDKVEIEKIKATDMGDIVDLSVTVKDDGTGINYGPLVNSLVKNFTEKLADEKLEMGRFYFFAEYSGEKVVSWSTTDGVSGSIMVSENKEHKSTEEAEISNLSKYFGTISEKRLSSICDEIKGNLLNDYAISKISATSSDYKDNKGKANITIYATVKNSDLITGAYFSSYVKACLKSIGEVVTNNDVEAYETILQMQVSDEEYVFWVTYDGVNGTLTKKMDSGSGVKKLNVEEINDYLES